MRKHVLIFVHGMGAYVKPGGEPDDSWSIAAAATLKEQYDKYKFVSRRSFEDRFEVVHVNYDTEIFKLVKRWETESQAIMGGGVASAAPVTKLLKWLEGGAKLEDNFAWTHAACVILYRFFPLMRQRLKIHVAGQFQKALAPNENGAVSTWSVIAHSLGTIVVHDVLNAMDATTPNEAGISILDTMVPSAQVVAMIANVSKVMESKDEAPVYDSLLVPQSMVRNQSCCFSYFNCNNKLDPFVLPKPFSPPADNQAWALAKVNGSYVDISIDNIEEPNVHSLRNYLVNPEVHIPLLEYLVGQGSITETEKKKAAKDFKNISSAVVEKARKKLVDAANERIGGNADVEKWFDLIGNYFSLLEGRKA
ncbi:MAG TPA: hypothetical protein VF033_01855 [Steroidobacteraceae bacterium]